MSHLAFNYYVTSVKKRIPWLFLISTLIFLLVFGALVRLAPEYEVHYSYIISLAGRESAPDFRYDGYYALQSTDFLAGTIAGWAGTPETIVSAYRQANVPLLSSDPRVLTKSIHAEKVAPQLVQITIKHVSSDRAEALAKGLQVVMANNIANYQSQSVPAVAFKVTTTPAWTGQTRISAGIIAVATFFFLLFFGINGIVLYESFKQGV